MTNKDFEKIVKERIRISDELYGEWPEGIQMCRDQINEILCRDINETIDFIKNKVSDEIFFWITEGFPELAEMTNSKELYYVTKERIERMKDPKERKMTYVDLEFMGYALGIVEDLNDCRKH